VSKEENTILNEINSIFDNREQIVKEKELEGLKTELEKIGKYFLCRQFNNFGIALSEGGIEGSSNIQIVNHDNKQPDTHMSEVKEDDEAEGHDDSKADDGKVEPDQDQSEPEKPDSEPKVKESPEKPEEGSEKVEQQDQVDEPEDPVKQNTPESKSIHVGSEELKANIDSETSREAEVRLDSGPEEVGEGDVATPSNLNPSSIPPLQVLQSNDPQNDDQAILEGNPASKNLNDESKDSL
jgi:hypothetical protein